MTMNSRVQARLEELIATGQKIKATNRTVGGNQGMTFTIPEDCVNPDQARQWTMSVLTLLKSAFGEDNDNYQQVKANLSYCSMYGHFCVILSCVKAALDDLKGGYFFESKALLEAGAFCDLMEQAEELQKAGHKDAAAVLAGGILEKHMRSMCARRSIDLQKSNGKPKMINDMNDDLAKAGAYNALKKKQITAWADLRNNTAHGNYTAYTSSDVDACLRDVSDFCANFS
jgi:hypothetical protein